MRDFKILVRMVPVVLRPPRLELRAAVLCPGLGISLIGPAISVEYRIAGVHVAPAGCYFLGTCPVGPR